MPPPTPPYVLGDEEEVIDASESDIELLDYDSDSSGPTVFSLDSEENSPLSTPAFTNGSANGDNHHTVKYRTNNPISSPDIELHRYRLSKGIVIIPGDTVELRDHTEQDPEAMHSGDFLRVKHIIMNLATDEVRLRGHLLRRTKYLAQIFDWKRNELALVLRVDEDDARCPFVAGMEDIAIDEVVRKRDCVLTNKAFPFQSFRADRSFFSVPKSMSKEDIQRQLFHGGRLACRVVYIRTIRKTGKDISGIVRQLYMHEADTHPQSSASSTNQPGLSRETSAINEDDGVTVSTDISGGGKRRARSDSLEILKDTPTKRRAPLPAKKDRYTFGDVFCGCGGASQGAAQAGLHVQWGLDNDKHAIEAYYLNHPGALPFHRNAHNFLPPGFEGADLRVDVVHLSPPCCYWSPAHTHDGPNDQENYEAIFTVGPILKKLKPRVATLEQTFGLMTHEQHRGNFRLLLHDIGKAGYDLRYKIQDMSKIGLVQQRKRLIIIAARRGTPLPPFPTETHGPTGSGLKRFVYIDDALKVMERLGPRALNDQYHQPKPMATPKPAYDSHSFLKGCITTGGGDNYHYSGKRRYTVREMAMFQSFPYHYRFTGSQTEAMKQVGNAFPPVVAEAMYRTIIKTLDAYDNGLIGAEDDLTDLEGILAQLRLNSSKTPSTSRELFEGSSHTGRGPNPASMNSLNSLFDGSRDITASFNTASVRENNDNDDDDVVLLGSSRRTS